MASDYFLKIDGVEGSSKDRAHQGWIEVFSFSWGVSQLVDQSAGRSGKDRSVGKSEFSSFNIMKLMDKASQTLLLACATGKHFPGGLFVARKAGERQQVEYLKIKLTDILVSSLQQSGSAGGDDVPMESLSLNFSRVDFGFVEQDEKGTF